MPTFRKKPVVIEARKVEGSPREVHDLAAWCGGFVETRLRGDAKALVPLIHIPTLEGTIQADPGDWIIKGVAGEFYPCKPEIFRATYDPTD